MSSAAQAIANQANAQRSTGPKTDEGKAISSLNNLRHGLAGSFSVLAWEDQNEFDSLLTDLHAEHSPQTPTEALLVQKMAEHYWLTRRATHLQDQALMNDHTAQLGLYLRYQTTHDRAFHKCLHELAKLRAEKRKAEIGFESQKRSEAAEIRKQQMHQARLRSLETQTNGCQIDNEIRQTLDAPLPGHMRVPFDTMKDVFKLAVHEVSRQLNPSNKAA